MNDDGEPDPRVVVRALKKLWYSFGFLAKEFPKTPESKGKPLQRPTENAARRYDLIVRSLRIVPDTAVWEENLRSICSIVARYGRQQVIGIDWDLVDARDLYDFADDIRERLQMESPHDSQNEDR